MNDLHTLADEYVIGLLDPAEAEEVAARITYPVTPEDSELARLVGGARDRLLPLDLSAPALAPSEGLWSRIEAGIAAQDADETEAIPLGEPAPVRPTPETVVPLRKPVSQPRAAWKLPALASMAAAVLLAAGLAWQVFRAETPELMVVLVNDTGSAVAVLEAYADNSVLVTPLADANPSAQQTLQLWTKPDPDGPPVSVGVLDTTAQVRVPGPALPRPSENQLYEITIEPVGGSPTGLPTGPVFGVGNAQAPVLRDG
ncbi:anti-sigma factor [Amaricoccus macauensis]|uniref:anti-sigma factor n=1 Tax=Amaricoccus macauensis TaxID=57001 RepID=UPI003C7A1A59